MLRFMRVLPGVCKMADIRRSVKTSFWSDEWIESLEVEEKYFFLYLLTNEKTKISGFYETTLKRMSFDTGLKKERIQEILKKFELAEKVYFEQGFIQIINFVKNQELNTNMQISVRNHLKQIPKTLKGYERLSNDSKGFQTLRKKEKEKEKEKEIEKEIEKESQDVSQPEQQNGATGGQAVTLSEIRQVMEEELVNILNGRGMSVEEAESDEYFNSIFDKKADKYLALCKVRQVKCVKAYITTLVKSDFNEFIKGGE